jgi:hypothetical protein
MPEKFWRGDAKISYFDTGFPNDTLGTDTFLTHKQGLRLVKLHGSIYWLKRDDGKVEEKEFDYDQWPAISTDSSYRGEVIAYPLSQKQLYVDPYIQMFFWLNNQLQSKQVWIVIGYSF